MLGSSFLKGRITEWGSLMGRSGLCPKAAPLSKSGKQEKLMDTQAQINIHLIIV